MAPAPEFLVFMSAVPALKLFFFMAPTPASVRFHTFQENSTFVYVDFDTLLIMYCYAKQSYCS